MTATRPRALLLAVLTAACGQRGAPPAADDEHEHGEHAEGAGEGAEHEQEGVVRIDPSLLRDLRLTTAVVERRAGGETVSALGEVRPDALRHAEVGSPIPARVTALLVELGDAVRRGTPLLELESVEVGRARAELVAARGRLALAEQTLARRRGLASDRIVPTRELQEAEAERIAAEAEVRALSTSARSLGGGRGGGGGRFHLTATVDGTVLDRSAALGQMVDPEDVLLRVGDLSTLWVVVQAFERDAVRVREGVPARVTFPALPGRTFDGTVERVGRHVDTVSRTIEVRVVITNPDGVLRPGMSATANIPVGDVGAQVLVAPSVALQRLADGWCAFVPRGEGLFEVRTVGPGRDLGEDIEILTGLEAGESIVVEGAFLLKAEAERARGGGGHEH